MRKGYLGLPPPPVYRNPNAPRVALVTGASSGIGRACGIHLAARGIRVYGTSRAPSSGTMLQMDVTDDQSVQRAVDAVLEREGRLDIVVNNAGIAIAGPFELTSMRGGEAANRHEPLRRVPRVPGRAANAYQELVVSYLGVRVNASVGFPSVRAAIAVDASQYRTLRCASSNILLDSVTQITQPLSKVTQSGIDPRVNRDGER